MAGRRKIISLKPINNDFEEDKFKCYGFDGYIQSIEAE